ncbi:hypothetical protein NDU88_003356 [Pleurodeles waltl]|uniref:Gypsy retrotransposon integrase-like protein 1 n=1 Tax=Pleurodeles waltl TaxID=8319 RepID=A0AAV7Q9F3_PLEWA|nr:hypothetical protein NDU88_003356 [Pleurodeles waltl]
MPFGLASAAAVFHRIMQNILKGVEHVLCFQDDVLIYGNNKMEHDDTLRSVLRALHKAGMTLKKEKCQFGVSSVEYLGHKISEEGVKPKNDLVKGVKEALAPSNKQELSSFLGLAEYMAKFVRNFAIITAPLRTLLKKDTPFQWSSECQQAFCDIKEAIIHSPHLGKFDPKLKTYVTTDASGQGIGAMIYQKLNGQERIVAFTSKALNEAERRYSTIERETLACFWAIIHFKFLLWGLPCTIKTDHKPLINVFTTQGRERATPRIAKWLLGLEGYNFKVEYVPGDKNNIADFLSRSTGFDRVNGKDAEQENEWQASESILWLDLASLTQKEWIEETEKDQTLQLIKNKIINGWLDKAKDVEEPLKGYWNVRFELHVSNDLVMRGERIVPPCSLWTKLVELAHEGHLGRSLTKNKLHATYWFPRMNSEVERAVRDCWACTASDKSHSTCKATLSPVNIPEKPWDKLGLDILGPMCHLGNKGQNMFVLVDYHSHWTMFKIVRQITTFEAIKFLTEAFRREGIPSTLVTDNGVQFTSENMKEFLKKWGVYNFRTALYNPKANGLVERMNRLIKDCIQRAKVSGMQGEEALNEMLWSTVEYGAWIALYLTREEKTDLEKSRDFGQC